MTMELDRNCAIYLDYHSTTPVDLRVVSIVKGFMVCEFGNASSVDHEYGDRTEAAVKKAEHQVSDLVGASPREIIWTSGATESINLVIQGLVLALNKKPIQAASWFQRIVSSIKNPFSLGNSRIRPRIALSPVEHKAVLDTCQALERRGLVELIYLGVDSKGRLDINNIERACAQGLSLLCVMAANNEIGNVYPIQKIGQIAQRYNIPFLCDASQAVGRIPIQFEEWGITFLTISAHKLYGPKGVGALVIRKGYQLEPLLFGGGQQKGIRPGTFNVPGIVGLGEACRLRSLEMEEDERAIAAKRDKLQELLVERIPALVINGDVEHRLAGNLHIAVPGIPNSAIIARVRHQLAISTGSACSSGVETPSHVLQALNLPESLINGVLRIGIGKFTTFEEIESTAVILSDAIHQCQQFLAVP
jgi:cysteine desulfurase